MDIATVSVTDSFEIKAKSPGSNHAPGLVVIFDGRQCGFRLPSAGMAVELLRLDGVAQSATVQEIKEHGDGRSFFFSGLTRQDAPIGTILSWSLRDSKQNRAADAAVA